LKELYKKVIPEIAKFELKIIDFQLTADKNNLIMRNFDEALSKKAEKNSTNQL